MALSRGRRGETNIWPGFVDAMTALVLVVMFVLTIVMVVQSVMREQLSAQESRLGALGTQVAGLSRALGLAERSAADLGAARDRAAAEAEAAAAAAAGLTADLTRREGELATARGAAADAEARLAALAQAREADRKAAEARAAAIGVRATEAERRAAAAEAAVAAARSETDAAAGRARLDAARADALEALTRDLKAKGEGAEAARAAAETRLTEAEAARATEAAAAEALRAKLASSDAELTAMTLALEESRKRAEETLTLLAAAEAAKAGAQGDAARRLTEAERQAGLLAAARARLGEQEALSAEGQRRVALLNAQVAELTAQLGQLQSVLDARGAAQKAAELRVGDLGQQLNAALLQAAEGEKARAEAAAAKAELATAQAQKAEADRALAAARAASAETEAGELARYRSEFFGRLSQILEGRSGVKVVGDRFVFPSDVVFPAAEATLSPEGRAQVAAVTAQLQEIAAEIPPGIDWILRVDGHTDATPLSGTGRYRDNWELSQARALAVVRYMVGELGFPPDRVAAAGFGEFRPAAPGDDPAARAANRRIELKLTER